MKILFHFLQLDVGDDADDDKGVGSHNKPSKRRRLDSPKLSSDDEIDSSSKTPRSPLLAEDIHPPAPSTPTMRAAPPAPTATPMHTVPSTPTAPRAPTDPTSHVRKGYLKLIHHGTGIFRFDFDVLYAA